MVENVYWQYIKDTTKETEEVKVILNKWIGNKISLPTLTENAFKDNIKLLKRIISLHWVIVWLRESNVISIGDKVAKLEVPAIR